MAGHLLPFLLIVDFACLCYSANWTRKIWFVIYSRWPASCFTWQVVLLWILIIQNKHMKQSSNFPYLFSGEGESNACVKICKLDCFNDNGVKIVWVKFGYVSIVLILTIVENLQCILACEPTILSLLERVADGLCVSWIPHGGEFMVRRWGTYLWILSYRLTIVKFAAQLSIFSCILLGFYFYLFIYLFIF